MPEPDLLFRKTWATWPGPETPPLPVLCRELLASQAAAWPLLRRNLSALSRARQRALFVADAGTILQCNPARLASALARVDPASCRERPCFLCLSALPAPQRGILYRRRFLLLCNPAPIFPAHFTVASLRHRPQAIREALGAFLSLAADMGPDFCVFYNGPRCGASAPDHLHFQAIPAGLLPAERVWRDPRGRQAIGSRRGAALFRLDLPGRTALLLTGLDRKEMKNDMEEIIDDLQAMQEDVRAGEGGGISSGIAGGGAGRVPPAPRGKDAPRNAEPLLNILAWFDQGKWTVVLFLRGRHRPAAYDRQGEGRIVVSPGAIDMAGFVITPREEDFRRLTGEAVQDVWREVSLGEEAFSRLLDRRKRKNEDRGAIPSGRARRLPKLSVPS